MLTDQFIVSQTVSSKQYTNCTVLFSTINIPSHDRIEFENCKLFCVNIVNATGIDGCPIKFNNSWLLFSDRPMNCSMLESNCSCIFGSRKSLKTLLLLGKTLLLLGGLCLLYYKVQPYIK